MCSLDDSSVERRVVNKHLTCAVRNISECQLGALNNLIDILDCVSVLVTGDGRLGVWVWAGLAADITGVFASILAVSWLLG